MKKIIIGGVILAVAVVAFMAWQLSSKTPTVKAGNHTFKLYVAKSSNDQQVGLSKYDKIDDSRGMIFTFGKPDYYSFWMKQMKFPIDIIYIKDNKIVTIHKSVKPPKSSEELTLYNPTQPSDKVLEVNAGLSQKYNIKEGDSVELSNI